MDINEQEDINKILDKVAEPSSESQPLAVLPQNNEVLLNENPALRPVSAPPTTSYSQVVPAQTVQEQPATVEHVQGTETDQVVQVTDQFLFCSNLVTELQ